MEPAELPRRREYEPISSAGRSYSAWIERWVSSNENPRREHGNLGEQRSPALLLLDNFDEGVIDTNASNTAPHDQRLCVCAAVASSPVVAAATVVR
jgi:hypothetical protein